MNPEATESSVARPPLWLPSGSVRALLTVLIVAVVVVETMRGRGRQLEELWSETLLIALAHYFTSRRFMGLSPQLLQRLESEGHIAHESNPLFLPRHSIRALIVLSFAGLAYHVFLVQQVRTMHFHVLGGCVITPVVHHFDAVAFELSMEGAAYVNQRPGYPHQQRLENA